MDALAVVLNGPEDLSISRLPLDPVGESDLLVDISWSGISTGTERLLFEGRMPPFPGFGYPLVPGYESVGEVVAAGANHTALVGPTVFVPGARCFGAVRGLFGGAAARVVVPAARATRIDPDLRERGVLIALATTAYHAIVAGALPDLIVGHGVLGRLLARLAVMLGAEVTVWETNQIRMDGALGYRVVREGDDPRRDYRSIYDVSGSVDAIDSLIGRLAPGGEIVLAGFYPGRFSFAFPAAFMREARFRIAAEWRPEDLDAVLAMIADGRLSLDGLITHRADASDAPAAYRTAFADPSCLKMILDWRASA